MKTDVRTPEEVVIYYGVNLKDYEILPIRTIFENLKAYTKGTVFDDEFECNLQTILSLYKPEDVDDCISLLSLDRELNNLSIGAIKMVLQIVNEKYNVDPLPSLELRYFGTEDDNYSIPIGLEAIIPFSENAQKCKVSKELYDKMICEIASLFTKDEICIKTSYLTYLH